MKYRQDGVVGIDLAGNESLPEGGVTKQTIAAFQYAKDNQIPITIHAGTFVFCHHDLVTKEQAQAIRLQTSYNAVLTYRMTSHRIPHFEMESQARVDDNAGRGCHDFLGHNMLSCIRLRCY